MASRIGKHVIRTKANDENLWLSQYSTSHPVNSSLSAKTDGPVVPDLW